MKKRVGIGFLIVMLLFCGVGPTSAEDWKNQVRKLAGSGAVLLENSQGKELYSRNADKPLVPASTLKIVTAAAALNALGPDYRFITDFHLTQDRDLLIAGRGDPYLISEELAVIAQTLKGKGLGKVRNILVHNGFFTPGLVLDGTERSLNPYDAYNGALCVNFNTIFVRVDSKGQVETAEPQTPLTYTAQKLALESRARGRVRLNLARDPNVCLHYAGELFKAFLTKEGVEVTGEVRTATQDPAKYPLVYRHQSRKNLAQLLTELLKYSNNFMTNQIFLTMGAERFGPPATPEKSRRVVDEFMAAQKIPSFHMEEGSGLSRRTRVTARQMMAVLRVFAPNRLLLQEENGVWSKTGTLSDVKSLVGYIQSLEGQLFPFVIILNGTKFSGASRQRILELLETNLK